MMHSMNHIYHILVGICNNFHEECGNILHMVRDLLPFKQTPLLCWTSWITNQTMPKLCKLKKRKEKRRARGWVCREHCLEPTVFEVNRIILQYYALICGLKTLPHKHAMAHKSPSSHLVANYRFVRLWCRAPQSLVLVAPPPIKNISRSRLEGVNKERNPTGRRSFRLRKVRTWNVARNDKSK